MLWSICGLKAGYGVSTVVAGLAAQAPRDLKILVVDFHGDQEALFGMPPVANESSMVGVTEWLLADVDTTSLDQFVVPVNDSIDVLRAGRGLRCYADQIESGDSRPRVLELFAWARARAAVTLLDLGPVTTDGTRFTSFAAAATDRRSLVVRSCYLGLRHAANVPIAFEDLIEVSEPGRSLRTLDIEGIFDRPVDAIVPLDPAVARAVDAGTFGRRCPRALRRLRHLYRTGPGLDQTRILGGRP